MIKKKKGITKCDKRTVTCDVGTAQCEDETVKCEKKKGKLPYVTKVMSNVHNVRMKPSNVHNVRMKLSNVKKKKKITKYDKSTVKYDIRTA